MKKAVGGKSRVDLAVDQIIQVILDRNMKAGDKLPNEYDLARELGVGRSTLREAIKRLVARNILTARQGAGTFVSEKNGVPEDPLGLTFMMEEGAENLALDLQDIRLSLSRRPARSLRAAQRPSRSTPRCRHTAMRRRA